MTPTRFRRRFAAAIVATSLFFIAAPAPSASAGWIILPPNLIACGLAGLTPQLSGLAFSGGVLSPNFASGTYEYDADLPNGTGTTQLIVGAAYANALLSYSTGGSFTSLGSGGSSAPIAVNPGQTIDIEIRAGYTTNADCWYVYTVALYRASGDARLTGLTVSPGGLTPAFSSGTLTYTASVANTVATLQVTPTAAAVDSSISMSVAGGGYFGIPSGSPTPVSLAAGTTTAIVVKVTAADGVTTRSYTITATRAAQSLITIPNVKGLKLKAAKAALRAAGFNNFRVVYLYNAKVPKNRVIRTTTGQRVANALITIKVSKGPRP